MSSKVATKPTNPAKQAKTSKMAKCEFVLVKGRRKGGACDRSALPNKTLCVRHIQHTVERVVEEVGGWEQFLQDLDEYNRTCLNSLWGKFGKVWWTVEPTVDEMKKILEETQSEWDGPKTPTPYQGSTSPWAEEVMAAMTELDLEIEEEEYENYLTEQGIMMETDRIVEENNHKFLAKRRAEREREIQSLDSMSIREMGAEMRRLGREMEAIGGWRSGEHGEFHTMRRRSIDLDTQIVAKQWKLPVEKFRTELVNLGSEEYDPGGGEYELCPDEMCDCEGNPRNPSWTDIYGMWV